MYLFDFVNLQYFFTFNLFKLIISCFIILILVFYPLVSHKAMKSNLF